jgi:hypothetical protein
MVMQTADVWDFDDRPARWRLSNPRDGSILVQREVSAPVVIIGDVAMQVALQRALVPHDDVIEHSRRREPIARSTNGFCQGHRGAVSTSSMPSCCTVRRTSNP